MIARRDFPPGFVFGVATASYQIEGGVHEDGRVESIWDRFARQKGAIADGSNGDVACDHRRLWKEDVALMRDLGVGAYRFSVAWPRARLDFYDRLVDALLEAGIAPVVTLYHWDLPQSLQDRGGWTNPDVASWFTDYTARVDEALGDRVATWITLNEPWIVAVLGHLTGVHAPGLRDERAMLLASKHQLLAHGSAVRVLREGGAARTIGISLNMGPVHPASSSEADRAAAERWDGFLNGTFADPLFKGEWPRVLADRPELALSAKEWSVVREPIDFLGLNYYRRTVIADAPGESPVATRAVRVENARHTEMGWEVYPKGLHEILATITRRYGRIPLYVTENGVAFADEPDAKGFVDDRERAEYIQAHLAEGLRAIADGVDLRGWFVWSILDNFEWALGYSKRFGLVRVDYATQARIPKSSAKWYASFLRG